MIAYLFLAGCLVIAAYRPVWGFAIFLASQAALAGIVFRFLPGVPYYYGAWAALVAILVLWQQRAPYRRLGKSYTIFLSLLLFTVLVFFRRWFVLGDLEPRRVVLDIVPYTFLWAPLFGALLVLKEDERELLWKLVAIIGGLVGIAGLTAYLTGSPALQILFAVGGSDPEFKAAFTQTAILKQRFITMGLFTIVPMAFCIAMEILFRPANRFLVRSIFYGAVIALMIALMAISVTRSLLLIAGLGTMVFLWLLFRLRAGLRTKVRRFMPGIVVGVAIVVVLQIMGWSALESVWSNRVSAMIQEGSQNISVTSRLEDSVLALSYASENILFFGAPGPNPLENYEHMGGDPALPAFTWIWYGLFGMLLIYYVLIVSLGRLYRLMLYSKMNEKDYIRVAALVAWSVIYLYQTIAGSYLLSAEVFMLILFISEIGRLHDKASAQRSPTRSQAFTMSVRFRPVKGKL